MTKVFLRVVMCCLLLWGPAMSLAQPVAVSCAPLGLSTSELVEWRSDDFETDRPDEAALQLADCLAQPDPFLRDSVGYEGLTVLLRGGAVSESTRRALLHRLSAALKATDEQGFSRPFAALALSEVARTDRIEPFLVPGERAALVITATDYLSSVEDYRGFDNEAGWRHGVAHGADLILQLVLNPEVSGEQLQAMMKAVAYQVMPRVPHAYVFGEPQRLARPVLYAAARESLPPEFWGEWFASLGDPAPLAQWQDAFHSEQDLARLHNLRSFALSVFAGAQMSGNRALQPLLTESRKLLEVFP